jgi:hypothetical protein
MTKTSILRAVLAASALGVSATPASAGVCTPPSGGHYYALFYGTPPAVAVHGASLALYTSSLTTATPDSHFVDHEMWYGVDGDCNNWVEVGVTDGAKFSGGSADRDIFWADNRAGGGYHEHYSSNTWSLNAWYETKVVWAGDDSWEVYFGALKLGTSTHNHPVGTARCLESGIESVYASAGDHVGGHMSSWKHKDANDDWNPGWGVTSLLSDCPADIDIDSGVTTEVLHGPN